MNKKLELVLSKIKKDFGDESIRLMSDDITKDVEVISTGCLSVDKALGIGGFPKGRFIEIYGPESSGKCLTQDALVFTDRGLLSIAEIIENTKRTQGVYEHDINIYNRYGNIEGSTHFTVNGKKPVYRISTKLGNSIKSTFNHKHLIMSESGNWVWKETGKLKIGDYLVSVRSIENTLQNTLTENECYLLGILIADGSFRDNRIGFTNNDDGIKYFIENIAPGYMGCEPKKYKNGNSLNSFNYHFSGKEVANKFYKKYDLTPTLSGGKYVPKIIRSQGKSNIISFLQGYFDCECAIFPSSRTIEVVSASFTLLHQVSLLLKYFGILTYIRTNNCKDYPDKTYWALYIGGDDAKKFVDIIGTRSSIRKIKHDDLISRQTNGSTNIDTIPNCHNLLRDLYDASETTSEHNRICYDYMYPKTEVNITYDRLNKILRLPWSECNQLNRFREIFYSNYVYDEITEIEELEKINTYDIVCPKTHSFIANGIVTHNTTLTLHVTAEAQKLGILCAFVDAEHALDKKYAKNLGIDLESWLVSQPDSGEQALEIVEALVRSGEVGLVVVDSVAALTPKAEIEGTMSDQQMGRQGALMSKAMRKLASVVHKSNCCVIFTNQLRDKLGVMFGSPEVTPGGKALRFYCSVRVDIRRITSIKIGSDTVGNRTRIKIVKNKLASPFTECEVDLIYGEGISKYLDIIDLAVEYGILNKSGAWYVYGDHKFQGKENTKEFLKTNPEVFEEIRNKVVELLK